MERIRFFSLPDSGILTFRAAGRLWVNACYVGRMRRLKYPKLPTQGITGRIIRKSPVRHPSDQRGAACKAFNEPPGNTKASISRGSFLL